MARLYLRAAKRSQGLYYLAQHLVNNPALTATFDPTTGYDGTVCWGISTQKGPSINRNANKYDKRTCFEAFDKLQVPHPVILDMDDAILSLHYPVLARRRQHTEGKDIRVCKTPAGVLGTRNNRLHDFFSVFIPTKTEYRAWVWRKRLLTLHEKVWKGQGEFQGYIRNHRFGFQFQKREELREDPRFVEPCVKAVKALELDFGAVDLLEGKDGKLYVLEVNTTPAIDSMERSTGIRLARAISRWAEDKL